MRITTCGRQQYGDLDGGAASSTTGTAVIGSVGALAHVLRGREADDFERRLVDVLHDDIFRRRDDLKPSEQCQLSYARMRFLASQMQLRSADLLANPEHMLALHAWTGLVDGTLVTLLTIHFNLCIGSILQMGEGRSDLLPVLAELERMDSIGVFLATELAHGNNVQALETEALYDRNSDEFVLHTPNARAQKYMPNTGAPGVAKIAVVMARLKVDGDDCGVFPFIVRIRSAEGLCPGVHVTSLGDKPDYALDNAVTSFDRVRVPRGHWLSGADSKIDESGTFSSTVRSRRARFLRSMDRVQTGKLCLSAVAVAFSSAALQLTMTYGAQRRTFSPTGGDVSILSYRTYQRTIFECVASNYASSLLVQHAKRLYAEPTLTSEVERYRVLALCKVFVSSRAVQTLTQCRERVGAQGMFSANRIISYLSQAHGIVTAEGDNEILLIKAARELLLGMDYTPPRAEQALAGVPMLESIDFLVGLVRAREAALVARLRAALGAATAQASLFDAWNDQLNDAVELASTHAARLALDCFSESLDGIADAKTRLIVERLLRSFALQEIAKFSSSLIVDGLLDCGLANRIGAERSRVAAELYQDVDMMTGAFQIPASLLDAPIGTDYVAAYDFVPQHSGRQESYIREAAVPPAISRAERESA